MPELTQLHGAIRAANNPMVVMHRVVDETIELIAPAEGALLGVAVDGELGYLCGGGSLSGHVGSGSPSVRSLAEATIRAGHMLQTGDAWSDERVDEHACRITGIRSAVCVPLVRGGELLGVLGVVACVPDAFSDRDVTTLTKLAEFISTAIGAAWDISRIAGELLDVTVSEIMSAAGPGRTGADPRSHPGDERLGQFVANVLQPGLVADLAARQRIERMVQAPGFTMRCQPIVDLQTGELVGAEALARFPGSRGPSDVWFLDADRVGLATELQLAAVEMALEQLDELPDGIFLAINVGPQAIAAPELPDLLSGVDAERIVLELTEHLQVEDYPRLHACLSTVRERGVRLAIDDTGAGFSSLGHIVHLGPELIKLDRQFTRGIDVDPVRRALAQALVTFARDTSADVVAEGVETAAELETVRDLGIPYGQGYYLGRPMAVRLLPSYMEHARRSEHARPSANLARR